MSHVLYEEEYLGNFPKAETFSEVELPLPLPDQAAEHQGLFLSTDGDQLLGRAENGGLAFTCHLAVWRSSSSQFPSWFSSELAICFHASKQLQALRDHTLVHNVCC